MHRDTFTLHHSFWNRDFYIVTSADRCPNFQRLQDLSRVTTARDAKCSDFSLCTCSVKFVSYFLS